MGETPDQLKAEIAGTRADMTATLDALTDRTSPRRVVGRQAGRVRDGLGSVRDTVMGTVSGLGDTVAGSVQSAGGAASGATDQLRQAPGTVTRQASGNPLAAGLVAFGAGLLLASVLPASEAEKRAAGAVTDSAQPLVEQAQQAAQEVAGQVQSSAQEAVQQVKEAATGAAEVVRQQAGEATTSVAGTARDAASDVKGAATGSAPADPPLPA